MKVVHAYVTILRTNNSRLVDVSVVAPVGLAGTGKRRFQIFLRSQNAPIELYLASKVNGAAGVANRNAQGGLVKLLPPSQPLPLADVQVPRAPLGWF